MSFLATLGAIGSAVAGPAINAIGTMYAADKNSQAIKDTNKTNMQMNEQNIAFQREQNEVDYQHQLTENEITRAREDNAYQRAVADAMSAGLSPLSVNGGAAANAMEASQGTAPHNQFAAQADTTTAGIIASGISNAIGSFLQTQKVQSDVEYQKSASRKMNAESTAINIDNAVKGEQLQKQLDMITAQIDKLTEERKSLEESRKGHELENQKKIEELNTYAESLKKDLELKTESLNEIKANVANTNDLIKSREQQRAVDDWNLTVAKGLGAPVGYVPSSTVSVAALAGSNTGRNQSAKAEAKQKETAAKNAAQSRANEAYEMDLKLYEIEAKRMNEAYYRGEMTKSELMQWKKDNPRPMRKDYVVHKKKK